MMSAYSSWQLCRNLIANRSKRNPWPPILEVDFELLFTLFINPVVQSAIKSQDFEDFWVINWMSPCSPWLIFIILWWQLLLAPKVWGCMRKNLIIGSIASSNRNAQIRRQTMLLLYVRSLSFYSFRWTFYASKVDQKFLEKFWLFAYLLLGTDTNTFVDLFAANYKRSMWYTDRGVGILNRYCSIS